MKQTVNLNSLFQFILDHKVTSVYFGFALLKLLKALELKRLLHFFIQSEANQN